jgi:MOSC domain-containing protein YiiM
VEKSEGRLESINTSRGGVPKTPVFEAQVTGEGIVGDVQRDLRHHGGPQRAVSIYSLDLIAGLQREGHPITAGAAGENLTVSGIEWSLLVPGCDVRVGDVVLSVTGYASPCENIRRSFKDENFTRISQKVHPGWSRVYCRVIVAGTIRPGDPVRIVDPTLNDSTPANRGPASP